MFQVQPEYIPEIYKKDDFQSEYSHTCLIQRLDQLYGCGWRILHTDDEKLKVQIQTIAYVIYNEFIRRHGFEPERGFSNLHDIRIDCYVYMYKFYYEWIDDFIKEWATKLGVDLKER